MCYSFSRSTKSQTRQYSRPSRQIIRGIFFILSSIVAISIALFVVALMRKKRQIILWGSLPLIGTLLQAVLGGITVLTGLNPFTVMAHFLLSIILVAISVKIFAYFSEKTYKYKLPKIVDIYLQILTSIGFIVIVLGTITTGSGPHSGDEIAARFNLDMREVAWLHADSVLLFVGLVIGLQVITRLDKDLFYLQTNAKILLAICVIQGFIGYVQWFSSVPWILVSVHVAGAVITWITLVNLSLHSSNSFLHGLK